MEKEDQNTIFVSAFCRSLVSKIVVLSCTLALLMGVAPTVSAAVSGTKTALIMLVSLRDAPIDTTVAEVTGMVFTNTPLSVKSFYQEATWGAVTWAGNVIDVRIDHYLTNCVTDTWADAADAAARTLGYEPDNYITRVYVFPSSGGACGYAWAYGNRVVTFHGSDLFCYAHEMGHSLGLHHAVTDYNNDGVIDDAYGGKDDCMGGESYTFNAPHKIWGGWLPERPAGNGGWKEINSDGRYWITPLEVNPANRHYDPQALKIVPPTGNPYFLSYRQPLGFDKGWTASEVGKDGRTGTSVDPVPPISANYSPYYYKYANGVTIHRHSGNAGAETYEICVLEDSQQFTIPGTGIVIRQTSHSAREVGLEITGFEGGTAPYGVTFFEHPDFGGAQSEPLSPGIYPLWALQAFYSIHNDWVSSCKIPPGLTLIMYEHENFTGTAWTNTGDVAAFSSLGADKKVSSCEILVTASVAPAIPTDLSAVSGDGWVKLSWTPSAGATSFNVGRSTVSGGPYSIVATTDKSVWTDTQVTNGVTYYYVLSAVNGKGPSAESPAVIGAPSGPLIAHWKFDEGSGSTAADASGNGNTGTLVNAPSWLKPGKLGPSTLWFAASSRRSVSVPNSGTLNFPAKAITLSTWILPVDWNGNRRILQKGNSDNQYRFLVESSLLKFHLTGVDQLTAAPLPPLGTWTHLAATWDGTRMAIYTNGVLQTSKPAFGVIASTSDPLVIGGKNNSSIHGDYFHGRLDDVRIYSRALSATELQSLMTNAPPTLASNPVVGPEAQAGQAYAASLAGAASDSKNDRLSFKKLSGPAWLNIAPEGALSGTPYSADVGLNEFTVRISDGLDMVSGNLHVNVLPTPAIVAAVQRTDSTLLLNWTGGIPPYQLQMSTNLLPGSWQIIADLISGNSFQVDPTNGSAFYRIRGK